MKLTTKLSLAVSLIDDYTGKQPIGRVKVFLAGEDLESVKNPSGYYLFLDLPGGQYQVRVEAEHYFAGDTTVDLPALDPLKEITLIPRPSYPFLSGATLIRGMVCDIEENPVAAAGVEVTDKNISTITTEKGEFVLYFKGLIEEDIIKVIGVSKRFVKGNPDKIMPLKAVKSPKTGVSQLEELEECTTASLEEPITLS